MRSRPNAISKCKERIALHMQERIALSECNACVAFACGDALHARIPFAHGIGSGAMSICALLKGERWGAGVETHFQEI